MDINRHPTTGPFVIALSGILFVAIFLLPQSTMAIEIVIGEPMNGSTIESESDLVKVKGVVSSTQQDWNVASEAAFREGVMDDVALLQGGGGGVTLVKGSAHYSSAEFSEEQDLKNWHFYEYDAINGNLTNLNFDGTDWRGTGDVRIGQVLMMAGTKHPVRAWTAPFDNTVAVRVLVQDRYKGTGGNLDGVDLVISNGDTKAGSVHVGDGDTAGKEWAGNIEVRKGDQLRFRLDPLASSASDESTVNISITTSPPFGTYTSKVENVGTGSRMNTLTYAANTTIGTSVRIETRSYQEGTWSGWAALDEEDIPVSPGGMAFQFRATFYRGNGDEMPSLKSVHIVLSNLKRVAVTVNNGSIVEAKGMPNWEATMAVREGPNTINAWAEDMLDGTVNATVTMTFHQIHVDRIPPMVTVLKPTEGEKVVDDKLHVEGIASDNIGLEGIYAKVEGEDFHRCKGIENWSLDLDAPSEGLVVVTVKAVDLSGNLVHAVVSVDFKHPDTKDELPFGGPALILPAFIVGALLVAFSRKG